MKDDFDAWLVALDRIFITVCGVSHDDVEDWLWRDDFNNGLSPLEAFRQWHDENLGELD